MLRLSPPLRLEGCVADPRTLLIFQRQCQEVDRAKLCVCVCVCVCYQKDTGSAILFGLN